MREFGDLNVFEILSVALGIAAVLKGVKYVIISIIGLNIPGIIVSALMIAFGVSIYRQIMYPKVVKSK